MILLSKYSYDLQHLEAKNNKIADYISRIYILEIDRENIKQFKKKIF